MTGKNDATILKLKEQIAKKKKELGKTSRFSPVTNLSIEFEGTRYNLNVLDKAKLQQLAIKVNMYLMSAKELDLEGTEYSGYMLSEWLEDILDKLSIIEHKEKEAELAKLEAKLSKMLSNEKQVELELQDIAEMLKD